MSTENTSELYPIETFGIATLVNASIVYHFSVITLPQLVDANGNPTDYVFSDVEVDSNTLKYTITLPEGAAIPDINLLTTYRTPEFLTQGEDYMGGQVYVIQNVQMNCNDSKVPVNSSTSTIKKSSLYDDGFDDTQVYPPQPYEIRYQILDVTTPTNDPAQRGYMVVYCKVPNPTNAWVEKQLYAIADGTDLYVTSVPKMGKNGLPATTTNTNAMYIVAAHFFVYDINKPYTSIEYEGLPSTHTKITT